MIRQGQRRGVDLALRRLWLANICEISRSVNPFFPFHSNEERLELPEGRRSSDVREELCVPAEAAHDALALLVAGEMPDAKRTSSQMHAKLPTVAQR